MEGLILLVSERTGLSQEIARIAVETVMDYLKEELPGPLADHIHIDDLLGGSGQGITGDALFNTIGGFFLKR